MIQTVNGRIVKVNDVRTRGGRPNLNRDNSRHDLDRSIEGDRGRDRGRGDNYDRYRQQEAHMERSQDYNLNRERGHEHSRGHDRNRYVDEERFQDYNRHMDDVELENGRKRKRDWGRGSEKNNEQQRNTPHHRSGDQDKQLQVQFPRRYKFWVLYLLSIENISDVLFGF